MQFRKELENPGAGVGQMIIGTLLLIVAFCFLFGLRLNEIGLLEVALLGGGIGMVAWGIWSRREQKGPVLVELTDTELRDQRSGDSWRWDEIASLKQVQRDGIEQLQITSRDSKVRLLPIQKLEQQPQAVAAAAIDFHRKTQGKGSLAHELHATGATYPCPVCGQESDSVKSYTYLSVVFLLVAYMKSETVQVACASCTRGLIVKNLLVNILTANILWPLSVLPWDIFLFLRSMTRGHSKAVMKLVVEDVVASGHESN